MGLSQQAKKNEQLRPKKILILKINPIFKHSS